jgi:hypothetical protein
MVEHRRAPLCRVRFEIFPPVHQVQLLSSSVEVPDSNANERLLLRLPPAPRLWYGAGRDDPADRPGDSTGQSSLGFNQLAENATPRMLLSNCVEYVMIFNAITIVFIFTATH